MNDTQLDYIEKILKANLATLREELRGIRSAMSNNQLRTDEGMNKLTILVEKHENRINGLEKLWQGLFGRLAFVAAIGGMIMAIIYEWLKKKIGFLP